MSKYYWNIQSVFTIHDSYHQLNTWPNRLLQNNSSVPRHTVQSAAPRKFAAFLRIPWREIPHAAENCWPYTSALPADMNVPLRKQLTAAVLLISSHLMIMSIGLSSD